MTPAALPAAGLAELDGIRHGFFTRRGGVSGGLYAGLNCGGGSGDDSSAVERNRRLVVEAMGAGSGLLTVHQVHGTKVARAEGPWPDGVSPRADALVSIRPGLALGVLAADCAPVLLSDAEAGVVAAAHAGWKGALAGVAASTVEAMLGLGAREHRIRAAVGPCIAQASYEVDAEFRAAFLGQAAGNASFFAPGRREGRHQFDLSGYVAARLEAAGIGAVEQIGRDTYAEAGLFYSYRRATHRGEGDYGRQLSVILLAPDG